MSQTTDNFFLHGGSAPPTIDEQLKSLQARCSEHLQNDSAKSQI